jgi:hypothetical protein
VIEIFYDDARCSMESLRKSISNTCFVTGSTEYFELLNVLYDQNTIYFNQSTIQCSNKTVEFFDGYFYIENYVSAMTNFASVMGW